RRHAVQDITPREPIVSSTDARDQSTTVSGDGQQQQSMATTAVPPLVPTSATTSSLNTQTVDNTCDEHTEDIIPRDVISSQCDVADTKWTVRATDADTQSMDSDMDLDSDIENMIAMADFDTRITPGGIESAPVFTGQPLADNKHTVEDIISREPVGDSTDASEQSTTTAHTDSQPQQPMATTADPPVLPTANTSLYELCQPFGHNYAENDGQNAIPYQTTHSQ
ncbi:unnamed protein product, partial [Medioppia subpectinata]